MRVALLGYGRMGREIERLALAADHEVVATLDIDTNPGGEELANIVGAAQVVVDFTTPDVVLRNIEDVASAGLPMVVGTTGWYEHLGRAREIVEAKKLERRSLSRRRSSWEVSTSMPRRRSDGDGSIGRCRPTG